MSFWKSTKDIAKSVGGVLLDFTYNFSVNIFGAFGSKTFAGKNATTLGKAYQYIFDKVKEKLKKKETTELPSGLSEQNTENKE